MSGKAKVLIAGAGIGGLTAAACLLKAGYDVEVYEQAPELGEVGAGLQSSANAVKVLRHLGLGQRLEEISVRPISYRFLLYDSGEMVQELFLAEKHLQQHDAPYYHIHRADLHEALAGKVRHLKPDAIALNKKATGFEEDDRAVRLRFEGGASAEGDLLVAADGIRSTLRTAIAGDVPATFTGDVAWRAVIPAARLPDNYSDPVVNLWMGPEKHIVSYFVRSGSLLNYVCIVEDSSWKEESWIVKGSWSDLKAQFAGWHGDVQTMIDLTDKDQCFRWALYNRPPVDRWRTERATLLGDAAHATLPYLAQGAAMAIEDAAILTRALDQAGSVAAGLDLYQRNRVSRTARIVRESSEHGHLYHLRTEAEFRAAFAKRNLAAERDDWLYSYDPLTVQLT